MTRIRMRTLGFALPTLAMVTAAHLSAERSVGEAVDGVVSGLWFTALYFGGAWLGARLAASAPVGVSWPRALAEGLLAGLIVWGALWAFWSRVPHDGPGFPAQAAFAAHAGLMIVAGGMGTLRAGALRGRTT